MNYRDFLELLQKVLEEADRQAFSEEEQTLILQRVKEICDPWGIVVIGGRAEIEKKLYDEVPPADVERLHRLRLDIAQGRRRH